MIVRRGAAVILGLLPWIAGCATSVIRGGVLNEPKAERIVEGVSALRGLSLREPVPIRVTDPSGLRTTLRRELDRQYAPRDIAALQRFYTEVGLLPSEIDLAEALLRLYGGQVAGFYDPRERALFLVDPPPAIEGGWLLELLRLVTRRDLVGEMLLAHELTHALQDQNFDVLGRVSDSLDEDRALAAAAAVEGDATLTGFAWLLGGLPESALLPLVERLRSIPGEVAALLPDAPALLRETLVFRYTDGARFAAWAYLAAGWDGVDAILANPPRSTEQVLWPEKYFVEPDDPTLVSLGGLSRYRNDPAWSAIEENTLGELMIRVLLREHVDAARAEWAARGWDGDRFSAWSRGTDTHLIWMTVWDSIRDAKDFYLAERAVLSVRDARPARDEASFSEATGRAPWRLERRADRVLVILGVPDEESTALAGRVWEETTFQPAGRSLRLDTARSRGSARNAGVTATEHAAFFPQLVETRFDGFCRHGVEEGRDVAMETLVRAGSGHRSGVRRRDHPQSGPDPRRPLPATDRWTR